MSTAIDLLRRWLDLAEALDGPDRDDVLIADTRRTLDQYDQHAAGIARHASTPPTARATDPDTSHTTVRSIGADRTLHAMIIDCAEQLRSGFDDQDLVDELHRRYGIRQQRNVVARARGLMEPSGTIVRLDQRRRPDRRQPTTHFAHWRYQP